MLFSFNLINKIAISIGNKWKQVGEGKVHKKMLHHSVNDTLLVSILWQIIFRFYSVNVSHKSVCGETRLDESIDHIDPHKKKRIQKNYS